jgi:hypothetical protein
MRVRRVPLVLAALALPAPAAAAPPAPPMKLPGDNATAASVRGGWLIGVRPTTAAAAIARRHGARPVIAGTVLVPRSRARALAAALRRRGLLLFAEPDRLAHRTQAPRAVPDDPLSAQARWRDVVADPALAPPAVTPESPLLALIDSPIDATHPEFAGSGVTGSGTAAYDLHGTATAAVAAAPVNGVGITGVWPGMRVLNLPLPERIGCSDSAKAILAAVKAGAAVINMSYGSSDPCYTEYVALQAATAKSVTLVAAAGNEFEAGNADQFPATLPHVLTIAAATPDGRSAFFSNESAAVDLSAPGVGILTAVPAAFDTDGTADGYMGLDGTSFSAPMVAAAAAWVRAARPTLRVDQVAQVVRLGATDMGKEGWDAATGFGMLSVGTALTRQSPPADPREPNEDVMWVDGRAFGKPDRPIGAKLFGLLDVYEDPDDVYRLRIPAGRRAIVTVKPRFGDPDIEVFDARTRDVTQRSHVIVAGTRRGKRTETVRFRNFGRVKKTVFLRVFVDPGRSGLDAAYDLRVKTAKG